MLDNLDSNILSLLKDDAKLTYREIGRKLSVSAVTILNRIKKLEKNGVISGYGIKINYDKIGFNLSVIIEVRSIRPLGVISSFSPRPEFSQILDSSSEWNLLLFGNFKSVKDFENMLSEIRMHGDVNEVRSRIVLGFVKNEI